MATKGLANVNKLELVSHTQNFTSEKKFTFNAGRFGMAIEGAVSIIPGHEVQEKSVMVSTAIDFLKKDFWLTYAYDDPKSEHHSHLNNIGWFLAIADFISLLDCIYYNSKEKSLVTLWQETNMKGLPNLLQIARTPLLSQKFVWLEIRSQPIWMIRANSKIVWKFITG